MAKFTNEPPDWKATGVEPTDEMKTRGFLAGYKAPAAYFNWFWTKVSACIKELFDKSAGVIGSAKGEVFNDYEGNIASGYCSHAEGGQTSANGDYSHAEGFNTSATGEHSHAEGGNTTAFGKKSHSEGHQTTASGDYSHAEGIKTNAGGYGSHSEGGETSATHYYAHAEGYQSKAISHYAHAEGNGTTASGECSHAEGNGTTASGNHSHAEGESATASALCSHAEGKGTIASGRYSHAEGYQTEASADYTHSEGIQTKASGIASHTEGTGTTATAYYAHAEGANTTARGDYSHAEGYSTNKAIDIIDLTTATNDDILTAWNTDKFSLAKTDYCRVSGRNCLALETGAHAMGKETIASGIFSHTEGTSSKASGGNSHAEGAHTIASGDFSHAEGQSTVARGVNSHAEGVTTTASGGNSHAEGARTTSLGSRSHAEGYSSNKVENVINNISAETSVDDILKAWKNTKFSLAFGENSHTECDNCLALGTSSHAEGLYTVAKGNYAHAEGNETTAIGYATHAEGQNTTAVGNRAHCEGNSTYKVTNFFDVTNTPVKDIVDAWGAVGKFSLALGSSAHAEGENCLALGGYSHAENYRTKAFGDASHASGIETTANGYAQFVAGKYNTKCDGATSGSDTTGSIFIVGVGTSDTARANAFRVTNDGKCMGSSSFAATGADYAEFYEWVDGNLDNEDRRGYFVTLEGNKIRKANTEDDYILGVISCTPAVVGNAYTDMWQGMYLTDVFGKRLVETVEVEEIVDEETGDVIPAHTETRFILNPDYDAEQQYISRENRKEWDYVGTHGQLVVIDDNTCKVNGYCKITDNGTATSSDATTDYRVIERLDDTHIRIVIK